MTRTQLSVNVNKYALLRNARGHNSPDLRAAVDTCLRAGAHGITVHPRRDERHIRKDDVPVLARHLADHWPGVELNVECEDHPEILEVVHAVRPAQCTLVPVTPGELTSDHGWRLPEEGERLAPVIAALRADGIRVSLFADVTADFAAFAQVGAHRVELYTGPYAWAWGTPAQADARADVWRAAIQAGACGLGLNAGHDLDRHNLAGLLGLPGLLEVSIGHAQICRALEVGTRQSVQELLAALGHAV